MAQRFRGGGVTPKQHYNCVLASVEKETEKKTISLGRVNSLELTERVLKIKHPLPSLRATLSKGEVEKKAAFTLAEVMVVLTILGIVAAITVPDLLYKQNESANRTKIKKALATYEHVVEQMRVLNSLQTVEGTNEVSLNGWASSNNCANGRSYFKIAKEDTTNPCIFKTNDGLWWNISTMSKPIVSFYNEKDSNATDCRSTVSTSSSNACYNKSFYMTTELDADKGNAFVVNGVDTDARYTLYYAKLIDLTGFDKCKIAGSKTCANGNFNYDKVNIPAAEVDLIACYDKKTDSTQTNCKSTVTDETLYVSGYISPTAISQKIDRTDCTDSTYSYCATNGDDYLAAKKYCKQQGGRLPTAAEVKALGWWTVTWVEESYSSDRAYLWEYNGFKGNTGSPNAYPWSGVICVSN